MPSCFLELIAGLVEGFGVPYPLGWRSGWLAQLYVLAKGTILTSGSVRLRSVNNRRFLLLISYLPVR